VERALQEGDTISVSFLGGHPTQIYWNLGGMSTRERMRAVHRVVAIGRLGEYTRTLVNGSHVFVHRAQEVFSDTVARPGYSGNPRRDSADLGLQYHRNSGPAIRLLPRGNRISLADTPGLLGAAYFIVTALVPLPLITHGLAFRILLRTKVFVPSRSKLRAA
jgi:hypothetical protein